MQRFTIIGGRPLIGSVVASGAKNAALPILAASILASEPVTIARLPRLTDVTTMLRLLESLGARVISGTGVVSPRTMTWVARPLAAGSRSDKKPSGLDAADKLTRHEQLLVASPPDCEQSGHPGHDHLSIPGATAGLPSSAVTIDTRLITSTAPAERFVQRMRASFCVLGPLLARHGRAMVPLPGGCRIGPRPVDLHLRGLAALGADLRVVDGLVIARAPRLRGARLSLAGPHGPTVTGTANVLCAATLARGTTIIEGAAIEPEIVDLGRFLNTLGARIDGLGTATLEVRGVEQFGGGSHELIADRIEAATLLAAGLITAGRVTVERVEPAHLSAVLEVFAEMGADVEVAADRVTVSRRDDSCSEKSHQDHAHRRRLRPIDVTARPYPGVPTDMQAQLMALAAVAAGTSTIADAVFGERFRHVPQLRRLGAQLEKGTGIISDPRSMVGVADWPEMIPVPFSEGITIHGVPQLHGTRVVASDLRASAALVLAALAAHGTTHVERLHHLDRGYEGLEQKLRSLGATIVRQEVKPRVAQPLAAGSRQRQEAV